MKQEIHNILHVYHAATPAERVDGETWYPQAFAYCKELGERYGTAPNTAAAIVAALSPGLPWERNKVDAALIMAAFRHKQWVGSAGFPAVGAYGNANRLKAERIWKRGVEALSGQKVISFYRCIIGATDVCIDRHAISILLWKHVTESIAPKLYASAQDCYYEAARHAGVRPSTTQAVTWVIWRNRREEFLGLDRE